jgi:hypothetical protein
VSRGCYGIFNIGSLITHSWPSPSLYSWMFMYCVINHFPSVKWNLKQKWHFLKTSKQNKTAQTTFIWICIKLTRVFSGKHSMHSVSTRDFVCLFWFHVNSLNWSHYCPSASVFPDITMHASSATMCNWKFLTDSTQDTGEAPNPSKYLHMK